MADERKSQRIQLTILEVKPRQVTNAERGTTKLAFRAKDEDGEHWYYTFRTSLFETIEGGIGQTFPADVVINETDLWGTQRDIKQFYVNNEPVGGKKQWQARQDSPETRTSIESQKRADIISQIWIAGKIKDDDELVDKLRNWLHKLGDNQPSAPVGAAAPKISVVYKEEDDLFPEETPSKQIGIQRDDLFSFVAEKKGWKQPNTVRTWLVNKCKIPEKLIDTDPQTVMEQLKVDFPEWF